jgi:hypothetical protein
LSRCFLPFLSAANRRLPWAWQNGCFRWRYALAADGVALVEVATEQAVLVEARAFRATGLSPRKVVEELDRKGLRARDGRTFAPAQIPGASAAPREHSAIHPRCGHGMTAELRQPCYATSTLSQCLVR